MAGMHTDRSGKQVVWEKRKTRNATFLRLFFGHDYRLTHAPARGPCTRAERTAKHENHSKKHISPHAKHHIRGV